MGGGLGLSMEEIIVTNASTLFGFIKCKYPVSFKSCKLKGVRYLAEL